MSKTERHPSTAPAGAKDLALARSPKGPQPLDPRLLGQVSGGAKPASTDLPKGTWK